MSLCDECDNYFEILDTSTHDMKQGCGDIHMTDDQSEPVMNGEVDTCKGFIKP